MVDQILKSKAFVLFIERGDLQDVQILIDNRVLYNNLPGKFERHGIKTLASWPFFVTAILNEQPDNPYPKVIRHADNKLQLGETQLPYIQLPIFDQTTTANPAGEKARKRKVERTLAEIRRLHDELNMQLYGKPTERPAVQSPQDAFDILNAFLSPLDHEELWILGLDTRNRVMNLTKLYQGSVNSSQVRIAEVFRQAINDNSPSIIIAHNHPSGDPTPSPDDVTVTRSIVQAGKLLDINVLDRLIVARERFISLKERGLGFS